MITPFQRCEKLNSLHNTFNSSKTTLCCSTTHTCVRNVDAALLPNNRHSFALYGGAVSDVSSQNRPVHNRPRSQQTI